jgi:hypothetical protein
MKRAWHYLLAEPFPWLFYAFFQPRRLERELAAGKFTQRLVIMLRMVLPITLISYPIAVVGNILLIPFHLILHPSITSILLSSAFCIAFYIALSPSISSALSIAGSIAFCIAGGITGGTALSIEGGIAVGIPGGPALTIAGTIAISISLGLTFGVLFGIAGGKVRGVVSNVVSGIVFGIAFSIAVGIAVGIASGTAFGIKVGISLGIVGGVTFTGSFFIGFFRLLFYPVSGPSALKAYLKSSGDPAHVFDYLHRCALYWDEIVYLPLPYLKQTLLIAYAQDAERAIDEIAFIATERPRQLRAARGASLEIAIGYLEQCKTMKEIAEADHYLDTIFPQETKLLDPLSGAPISRMREASRDAQRFSSPIGRRPRLEALDDMVKQLKGVHPNVAFRDAQLNARLGKVVDVWLTLALRERESLRQVPIFIGRIDNPYNPGYPLKLEDPLFQGRRDLVQVLESELMKGDRRPTFLLASERRMGKSSALLQLPRLLGSRFLPIFYDLQTPSFFANTPTFLGTLADGIYKEMRARSLPVDRLVYRTLRDFSTQIAHQANPSPNETLINAQSTRSEISPYIAYSIFDGWLRNVESVLEKEGRTLLLMLDEFEKLEEAGLQGSFELNLLLDWLRNTIQYHPRIALLFSGLHSFDEMHDLAGKSWSGYFVNVQTLHVSFLQQVEARHLITGPTPDFPDEEIYGEGVVECILDKTGCHPFLVQAVCYALIENLNAKKRECATIKDVDGAIERIFENFNNYFSDLWNRTDKHQRICLIALHKVEAANREQLQQQSGLKESILWRTLDTLLKRDLIRQEDEQFSISTPIFSEWVERNSRYM